MDDEVLRHLLNSDVGDVFKKSISVSLNASCYKKSMELIDTRMETVTEANDVLKNGILIETSKG